MSTKTLTKANENFSSIFDDFFQPWNEWFKSDNLPRRASMFPAVNITEEKDMYKVSLAVPGMKKDDIHVDLEGNVLTVSASKEDEQEEKNKKYTRREYNYSSFSRSFTIPEEVQKDKIDAEQKDGIVTILLPKKEERKNAEVKKIAVH